MPLAWCWLPFTDAVGRKSGGSDWRIPAGLAGAAIVIGLVAVYFGGLDVQVLSEAPKSVLYRLEYWQATARVIAQYPIFGCGPGNFQRSLCGFTSCRRRAKR